MYLALIGTPKYYAHIIIKTLLLIQHFVANLDDDDDNNNDEIYSKTKYVLFSFWVFSKLRKLFIFCYF